MTRGNYFAVNKDTDELYHERIHADKDDAERIKRRFEMVIFAAEPPARISEDPAWYQCKLCDYHEHCHGTAAPLPTCRSCCHATPERDGTWSCDQHNSTLSVPKQKQGCGDHRFIPVLLAKFAEMVDANPDENWARYKLVSDGREFVNGEPPDGVTSAEIHAAQDKRMLVDEGVREYRVAFDGRISA